MLDAVFAERFAKSWIEAWNSHDLSAVLAHYRDDFEMRSPYIASISGVTEAMLCGKTAVGAYWQAALEKYRDLHFTLLHVLVSSESFMLVYRSVGGRLAAEVFYPDASGLIHRASAHYGPEIQA
ncbi:MAG: nuclear transport factor 2 family protein [Moraxellaceae bacterium]